MTAVNILIVMMGGVMKLALVFREMLVWRSRDVCSHDDLKWMSCHVQKFSDRKGVTTPHFKKVYKRRC